MIELGEKLNEYKNLIQKWGVEKGLINMFDSQEVIEQKKEKQFIKIGEETGEILKAYLLKESDEKIKLFKDAIGDTFVTYVISLAQNGIEIDFEELNYNLESSSIEYLDGHIFNFIHHLSTYKTLVTSNKYHESEVITEITELINNMYQTCKLLNIDLLECIDLAWNEIKDRKGSLISGTFVKDGI